MTNYSVRYYDKYGDKCDATLVADDVKHALEVLFKDHPEAGRVVRCVPKPTTFN